MPERPPGLTGSAVADRRTVRALARGTNQIWIAVEDVEWLINYVATEVAMGGVPQLSDAAVAENNCEVKDLRVQWDFGKQAWKAEFCGRGTERTSSPHMCVEDDRREMGFSVCRSCGGI